MGVIRFVGLVCRRGPLRRFLMPTFISGQIAVQSFYVISGFYMALVLEHQIQLQVVIGRSSDSACSIYPVYYLVALATLVASFVAAGITSSFIHSCPDDEPFPRPLTILSKVFVVSFRSRWWVRIAFFTGPGGTLSHFTSSQIFGWRAFKSGNFSWCLEPGRFRWKCLRVSPFTSAGLRLRAIVLLMGASFLFRYIGYWSLVCHDPWTYRFSF